MFENLDFSCCFSDADKFLSVTLAQEKLSPPAEKERRSLAEKFKNLITQLGLQSEQSGVGKPPPRPPKGGIPIPAPVPNTDEGGEELYDDLAGKCGASFLLLCLVICVKKLSRRMLGPVL